VGFKVEREEMEWDGKEGGDTNGFYIGTWVRLLKKRIRISSSWRSIGESHVVGSWPLMKSNGKKSVSRFCVIDAQ
jgi:hypothetical protein